MNRTARAYLRWCVRRMDQAWTFCPTCKGGTLPMDCFRCVALGVVNAPTKRGQKRR